MDTEVKIGDRYRIINERFLEVMRKESNIGETFVVGNILTDLNTQDVRISFINEENRGFSLGFRLKDLDVMFKRLESPKPNGKQEYFDRRTI